MANGKSACKRRCLQRRLELTFYISGMRRLSILAIAAIYVTGVASGQLKRHAPLFAAAAAYGMVAQGFYLDAVW